MDAIYLVVSETGEYSDRQKWYVRAFATAAEAQVVCDRCTAALPHPGRYTLEHGQWVYGGTRYYIAQVPFGAAK